MVTEKTIKKGFKKLVEDYKQQLIEDHMKGCEMSELKDQIVKDIKERVAVLNALFVEAAKEGIEVYIKTIDRSLSSSSQANMEIRVILKEIL